MAKSNHRLKHSRQSLFSRKMITTTSGSTNVLAKNSLASPTTTMSLIKNSLSRAAAAATRDGADDTDDIPLERLFPKKRRVSDLQSVRDNKTTERSVDQGIPSRDRNQAVQLELQSNVGNNDVTETDWQWTDEEQVVFRPVARINVHDTDAAERVTEARRNGVPVCLVGHCGWPQFAKRWLRPLQHPEKASKSKRKDDDWIDLSQPHKVNVEKMTKDIGNQIVPLLRPDYDEENPCKEDITVSEFLKKYWKDDDDDNNIDANGSPSKQAAAATKPAGYLHQWQFPLSAPTKLCAVVQPLPNHIFGEDLLRYWLDYEDCQGDSPFQYLFMGAAGTMSKLHRDDGGLAISIAPIVGEKECVMVHRSDGATCMYHLNANLDAIDLQQYPLMSFARVWKTVLHPGEILIMPQGTFHQCRNVTPCLSYSRFHLDTVNLRPFLESWINRDAPETDHCEIIWNASCELRDRLDKYVKKARKNFQASMMKLSAEPVPHDVVQTVNTLRSLRNVCRVISQRLERVSHNTKDGSSRVWNGLVYEIDLTLHEFRYRYYKGSNIPSFPQKVSRPCHEGPNAKLTLTRRAEQPANGASISPSTKVLRSNRDLQQALQCVVPSNEESLRTVGFVPDMNLVMSRLSNVHINDKNRTISESIELVVGARIEVRYHGKQVNGQIINVVEDMQAAYISFEGYNSYYDEYQAFECLRMPMSGDLSSEVHKNFVRDGSVVLNRWGEKGEVRRNFLSPLCCVEVLVTNTD